jgi:peptidoglycan/xylan/chitin deacetylase (PgdA/CDA1 family)
MRPSIIIAKMATRVVWPLTRLDRGTERLVPPVLCYHRVLPRAAKCKRQPPYSVTPDQFEEQMSVLAREGFTSLTFREFYEAAAGLRELPARSVLLTFDDGFSDNYSLAWPIAQQFGMKLNLFICTGLVSGNSIEVFAGVSPSERASRSQFSDLWQPLQWSEIREMTAAGVDVGFHSHDHRNLGFLSAEQIATDADTGISLFIEQLGFRPRFFAFPFGHFGSYSRAATLVLQSQGMELFFTTELGRTAPAAAEKIFSRIVVHPEDDLLSFRRKVFGGYDWMGGIRRLNYAVRARY